MEGFKDLYEEDIDFSKAYKVCKDFVNHFHSTFSEYTLYNGLMLKGPKLCIPRGSMRENLKQEKHNGSMSGYFGLNKTLDLVQRF